MSDISDKQHNSTNTNSSQKQAEFDYSYDKSRKPIGTNKTENTQGFVTNKVEKIKNFMNNKNIPQDLDTTSDVDAECNSDSIGQKISSFFSGNTKIKRIIFFVILLIIILLLILWLKSSNNKTIDSFESSDIQYQSFQPIDNVDPNPNNFNYQSAREADLKSKIITIYPGQSIDDSYTVDSNNDKAVVEEHKLTTPEQETVSVNTVPINTVPIDSIPINNEALNEAKEIIKKNTLSPKPTEKVKVVEDKKTPIAKPKKNTTVITIKKGESLIKLFRDQGLNVQDLNTMVHTKTGGKTLNSFKPGDKVRVTINKNGHIETLTLKSGSFFIRQTDGSYIFLK